MLYWRCNRLDQLITSACLALLAWPSFALPAAGQSAEQSLLAEAAQFEQQAKNIPSLAVVLVGADGEISMTTAGHSDAAGTQPAGRDTPYAIGTLAGLLSDLATLRLAQQGTLNLDAPITRYLPELRLRTGRAEQIRVRHLITHRSGLQREPQAGSLYLGQPAQAVDIVASLANTGLVAPPGTVQKYSDYDRIVLDRILERVTAKPLAAAQQELLFSRMSIAGTRLHLSGTPAAHAVVAPIDAPRYTVAATSGAWISTPADLSRLAHALLAQEQASIAMLDDLWPIDSTPLADGLRRISVDGRSGFAYAGSARGYTAYLSWLPKERLAAIAVLAIDDAGPVATRLVQHALRTGLALRNGRQRVTYASTSPVSPEEARIVAGSYRSGHDILYLRTLNGRLYLETATLAGEVRRRGTEHVVDDIAVFAEGLVFESSAIRFAGRQYERVQLPLPPEPPVDFANLIGDYGTEETHFRIYERDGRPYTLVNGSSRQRLIRVTADRYAFPANTGPYRLEHLDFSRDTAGRAQSLELGGIVLKRRDFGREVDEKTRSMARFAGNLRADALAAKPPTEPGKQPGELVELERVVPRIKLDMRYATTENFMGIPFYESKRAFMQRPAAAALTRAQQRLLTRGYGLAVHDAYRPWFVTRMFWDAMPPEGKIFLADPAEGSRHNRGCAIDVTLYDLATGNNVTMPGAVDEVSSHSSPLYLGGSSRQRWLRDLLKDAMAAAGFTVDTYEWWHFDHPDWPKYPLLNLPFERISPEH